MHLLICYFGTSKIGESYHIDALTGLFKAPISFFETNPVGRILNRFNGDVVNAERTFAVAFTLFSSACVSLLGATVIISLSSPYMIVLVIVFTGMGTLLFQLYVPGKLEGNRLEPLASSNLFTLFHQALEGSSTIMAYRQELLFLNKHHQSIDMVNGAMFLNYSLQIWLVQRAVLIGAFIAFSVGMVGSTIQKSSSTAATIGLALTYSGDLTNSITRAAMYMANVEARVCYSKPVKFSLMVPTSS